MSSSECPRLAHSVETTDPRIMSNAPQNCPKSRFQLLPEKFGSRRAGQKAELKSIGRKRRSSFEMVVLQAKLRTHPRRRELLQARTFSSKARCSRKQALAWRVKTTTIILMNG